MTFSLPKTIIFSLIPVTIIFVFAEAGLRLFYHPNTPFRFYKPHSASIMMDDRDLGYRLRPNVSGGAYASHVATNSLGFRGPELMHTGTYSKRIIALGDSCTFGFGASDNGHTYPAQLQRLFAESGESVEIVNAGVVGYSSWQVLQFLKRDVLRLKPDRILIYVGWNDMGNSLLPDWKPSMIQDLKGGGMGKSTVVGS